MSATAPAGDLAGRVAIVTGASSGIGRATALLLAAAGARVLATGRDEARLAAVARESGALTLAIALESEAACAAVVDAARRLGPPAILVHAAGLPGYIDRPIWEQSPAAWRQTMTVNLDAPFWLTRLVAGELRDSGAGRVVMVSSTAGQVGAPAMAPYCASKHGLLGLMRSVAQDLAPFGGTCNAVLPGWVKTPMADADAELEAARRGLTAAAVWAERAAASPAKRILEPLEVARVIAFLASDAAGGVNGEAVTVSLGSLW